MAFPIRIVPRYRLLLRYDIRPDAMDTYYEFIMNEFIPALQSMGLYMAGVWHTAIAVCVGRGLVFRGVQLPWRLDGRPVSASHRLSPARRRVN